ncbi:glucans biosynthesis glucosyltransferase MdoH [Stieleria neptunia]|uniref:glucans biosynthesis glucosyltransferase MdoH n=1 Tax=Stieleria neptunia TaxID=2527979 RepID=UPI0018D26296|nr:glucans biosynthesis glucosyltransferase MdoH [Stieleria neptunia]
MKTSNSSVRVTVIMLSLGLTAVATASDLVIVGRSSGINLFEAFSAAIFALLFGWIAFSFVLATLGFLSLHGRRRASTKLTLPNASSLDPDKKEDAQSLRTAVLMPVYNEAPERVIAGIEAMIGDLRTYDATDQFDFYLLSDTTQSEVWLQEELVWSQFVQRVPDCRVFYRHRPHNKSRKAGNIADFCIRWGASYPYMIVLDADSLMSAATMLEMVARMRADTQLGILQVPPAPVGRNSLFARLQQFAAHAYGPIFVAGFARWAGDDGNYWGHNAIIRVRAFLEHCDLPVLPGKEPLGGAILSHDFVEAALMVRSGWKVQIATDLQGSFEECPTTLADYAQRDQRWCQGNLQHAKLLTAENYRTLSRFHFASGVLSYAASPIWIAFMMLCVSGMLYDHWIHQAGAIADDAVSIGAITLFSISMIVLFLPKLWAVIHVLSDHARVKAVGGAMRLISSTVLESMFSVLLSPIMALYHSWFVFAALMGTSVSWSTQNRNEHCLRWEEVTRQFWTFTAMGLALTALIAWWMPPLLVWFSPVLIGLVVSIPLAKLAASVSAGKALKRAGLLLIPQETEPCDVIRNHRHALERLEAERASTGELFERFISEPSLHALHQRIQLASDASVTMHADDARELRHVIDVGGVRSIPPSLQRALLLDCEAFRELHLDVVQQWQLQAADHE